MNDTTKEIMQQALYDLEDCARLLGATYAKKGYGIYTEQDARFVVAMHEAIAKHRKTIEANIAQPEQPTSNIQFLYEQLRQATDGGSESMTHDDALEQIKSWSNLAFLEQPEQPTASAATDAEVSIAVGTYFEAGERKESMNQAMRHALNQFLQSRARDASDVVIASQKVTL